jgi:hypothetical protein
MTIDEASNEVLRKIGRNILLFQSMEKALKYLVVNGRVSACARELMTVQRRLQNSVSKQTLGAVAGRFFEDIYNNEAPDPVPEKLIDGHFMVHLSVDIESDSLEQKKTTMASLIQERNDLVHHFLGRLNSDSLESWTAAEAYLDEQRERLLPELEELESIARNLSRTKREAVDQLENELKNSTTQWVSKIACLTKAVLWPQVLSMGACRRNPDSIASMCAIVHACRHLSIE